MIDYRIRFPRCTDVRELVRLCADHAAHERAEYDRAGKCDLLAETLFGPAPPMRCLVVELDSRLVGYATFGVQYSTWRAANYLYLDCLYLDNEVRGHGIGQRMMALIQAEATGLGCCEVQWQTPDFNGDAIRFYDRIPQTGRHHKWRYVWPVPARSTCSIQPVFQKR